MRTYTIGYPFCGSGVGACGSDAAVATVRGESATFRNVGGIDFDAEACEDFRRLTGAPALCADITTMTPEQLRAFWGPRAPDDIEGSPPCKAGSALLPLETATSPEYQAMNRLMLVFSRLLFAAYPRREDRPRIAGFENVPSLLSGSRARTVVDEMVRLWEGEGYVSDVRVHDLGEEGGLAQRRRRLGVFFRDPLRCPSPVEMPPAKPLRAVGEVLGPLPWADDSRAGPMHRLPRLSWVNMVRLALIGIDWRDGRAPKWDWRDLPPRGGVVEWLSARGLWPTGVGAEGRRHLEEALLGVVAHERKAGTGVARHDGLLGVQQWEQVGRTVIGACEVSRAQAYGAVADPRVVEALAMGADNEGRHTNKYAVRPWEEPARTVIGAVQLGSGAQCVADPRVLESIADKREGRPGFMGVGQWGEASSTVTARTEATAGQSMGAVADPRVLESLAEGTTGDNASAWHGRPGYRGVVPWSEASPTVTANVSATGGQGPGAVADERALEALGLGCRCRNGFYGVLPWDRPSNTVTGSLQVDCGTGAVADPRPLPRPVISLKLALQLLAEGWEVPKGALAPAILAPDNTWHRPLTTLELAVLQGLPPVHNGKPLVLAGKSDRRWREHIGNGIPRDAALAWGGQHLTALLLSDMGAGDYQYRGDFWVRPELALVGGGQ